MRPYEQFRDELVDISRDFSRCSSVEYRVLENRMPRLIYILLRHRFSREEEQEIRALFGESAGLVAEVCANRLGVYAGKYENLVAEVFANYCERTERELAKQFAATRRFSAGSIDLAALTSELGKTEVFQPFDYMEQLATEVKLANVRKRDRVLWIGSGPLPLGAIVYAMLIGCAIDCYEKSAENAETSQKLLEQIGMDRNIRVYAKDGCSLHRHSYDVVAISPQGRPIVDLFAAVRKASPANTRVVFRMFRGIVRDLFVKATDDDTHKIERDIKKNFTVTGLVHNEHGPSVRFLRRR